MPIVNISGQTFGRLVVTDTYRLNKRKKAMWLCVCKCGIEKYVSSLSLRQGTTVSCGCFHKEVMKSTSKWNGLRDHPLYSVRRSLLNRCKLITDPSYHRYGGRGIGVCDQWKKDFKSFYDWAMANGWQEGLDIDRKDNNGNYEPGNCRFVTRKVNANNRECSTFLTIGGTQYSMDQLETIYGIPSSRIVHRIKHNKWSVEKALVTPVAKRPEFKKK